MTAGIIYQVCATVTLTKVISDADVALFTLVTNDQPPGADEPMAADGPQVRESESRAAVPSAPQVAISTLKSFADTFLPPHSGLLPDSLPMSKGVLTPW